MDKKEAIKRLDALDEEAKKLREIIEGKELVYDNSNIYIGIKNDMPFIMIGYDKDKDKYFRFHTFAGPRTEEGWFYPKKTGQECLDWHVVDGFDIHVFNDTRKAFEFFLSKL